MATKKVVKKEAKKGLDRLKSIPPTLGEKASDTLSQWAGSWKFIIGFLLFLFIWMYINVYGYVNNWDPYPFILLNLILSCIAALQAPIILMSQNRQSQKDRQKADYDYLVNRKSERKIEEIQKQLNRIEQKLNSGKKIRQSRK
jgi:uncharacterized membrane protein